MANEKIGNVILNLNYYKGEDKYSDGSIEDEMLDIIRSDRQVDINSNWALKYHLHPDRGNIIEWYDFEKGSNVLEIGAGCGAITQVLLKKDINATVLEMSYRRALINAERNKAQDVEIIVGNFFDVSFEKKFDYITVIGVLEYIETFSEYTYQQFFNKIKSLLKPNGKILLAIENRFGLKYFAGAREDHSGVFFEGIEGYDIKKGTKTFTKNELTELVKSCGFNQIKFYYPFPDYKFPYSIFSEEYLPQIGDLRNIIHNFDQDRMILFDEEKVYDSFIKNGFVEHFANSFFIEVSES